MYIKNKSIKNLINLEEIPVMDNAEIINPAQSEHYGDFIIRYTQDMHGETRLEKDTFFQPVNENYGILYVPLEKIGKLEINNYNYNTIPKCYTYMDLEAQNNSGIIKLQEHPYLKLKGKGTAIVIIDSGIDLKNPLFYNEYGSRITWLWDQTINSDNNERVPFGKVYTKEEIDQFIFQEKSFSIGEDLDGHGTALAALAAGNRDVSNGFSGAAPEAEIIVVKLKPAKEYLKEFYLYPDDVEVYQEDDIMLGIAYAINYARFRKMPISICLGIGSNQGAHEGESHLSQYIDHISRFSQISVSIAAGNEGISRHHFEGKTDDTNVMQEIAAHKIETELNVGNMEQGFTMELWAMTPAEYEIMIQSPTGEQLKISNILGSRTQELSFVFVETKILVNYIKIELETGKLLVYFRFLHPASGIWKIITFTNNGKGHIHMWLPVQNLISEDTYFLEASPYCTITTPGDSQNGICITAYDEKDNSLYIKAGRGFTPEGNIVPQIAAPGVNVIIPGMRDHYIEASGTSYSTAIVSGAAALLFEWAIIRGNEKFFTGSNVKNYIKRGAVKEKGNSYPNREWGYGYLNLYHIFELLT